MDFLAQPAAFLVGLGLLAAIFGASRSKAARRYYPDGRELADELRGPQISLVIYLVSWLWLFFHRHMVDPQTQVSRVLVHACGGIAMLRVADVAIFSGLRALRGLEGLRQVGPSRIVRSVVLWVMTFVIVAAFVRSAWQLDLGALLTTSALLSVVLGFALQEPLGNLFAGLTLNAEHPFEPGDWISFDQYVGRVVDVGWRSTRLTTSDDDELLVPNGFISRAVVVNHSRPSARRIAELQITVDLEASPAEVKRVLLSTARAVGGVLAVPEPTVQLLRFAEHGVLWKLKFATQDFNANDDVRDRLQQALWYSLRRAGLELSRNQLSLSRRERPADAEGRRKQEHFAEAEELLGRIDFVAGLKPEARAELARHARFLEYGPGEAVVRQGEVGDAFYLVAHGDLSVRVEGREQEVARLKRGDFFGEVALLTGEKRTATVVAIEDAQLLGFDRDAFARLFAADEAVMELLAHAIVGRKAQLATAREQASKEMLPGTETQTMLTRIRGIFGRRS